MLVRNVGKWACMLVIAWTGGNAVVSCGGSEGRSVFVDAGGWERFLGGLVDATQSDAPSFLGDDGGGTGDGGGACIAKTCAELRYDCGKAVQCGQVSIAPGRARRPVAARPPQLRRGRGAQPVRGCRPDGGAIPCTPTTCAVLGTVAALRATAAATP